jgi:glycosyltransferase 2 family protein
VTFSSSPSDVAVRRMPPLGLAVLVAVLVGAVVALRGQVAGVSEAGGLPGPGTSVLAVAASVAGNLLLVDAWRALVAAAGPRLDFTAAARVWTASQLARYTIGAAQVPGRALAGRAHGIGAVVGTLTTLVEIAWGSSLTAVLVLATAPTWLPADGSLDWMAFAAVAPAVVLAAGLVAPQKVLTAVARLMRRLGVGRLTAVRVDRQLAVGVTVRYAVVVALRVVVAVALYRTVGGDVGEWPAVAGAWALGQLAGQLAIFAPGGLGVREGATALVLAPAIGPAAALLLVALIRLAELVAELLTFGLAQTLRHEPERSDGEDRIDSADAVAHIGQVGGQAHEADEGRRGQEPAGRTGAEGQTDETEQAER